MARYRYSLARQFYLAMLLCLATLGVLAAASVHFAIQTSSQARLIEQDGLALARLGGTLLIMTGEHRVLVDAASTNDDPASIPGLRTRLHTLETRIGSALADPAVRSAPERDRLDRLDTPLSGLFGSGRVILSLAEHDIHDPSLAAARAAYDRYARALDTELAAWRQARQGILDRQLSYLRINAATMIHWAQGCAAAAVLTALFGAAVARRAARRLRRITGAMLGLAGGRADVAIPKGGHPLGRLVDEIDDLSRAARVFKASALQAARQRLTLQRTNALFDAALNNMRHGLIMFDASGRVVVLNRQVYELYGLDRSAVGRGTRLRDVLTRCVECGNFPGRSVQEMLDELKSTIAGPAPTSTWTTCKGRTVVVAHESTPDGGWISTHQDVTERRQFEERLRFIERHDGLTRLANRLQASEHIKALLGVSREGSANGGFAVHCLDIANLKPVNDTLGHETGDALLRLVADRLRGVVRDGACVARLDGDRFAVIQPGAARPDMAAALARRIIRAVAEPYRIGGNTIVIGASIGIALAPHDGRSAELLLRNANLAVVRVKGDARGGWHFFEPGMDARAQARRSLETDLRAALERHEFEVWYQPLLNTSTRGVCGFEALVRWRHPVRGLVGPAEFIPVAEDIGVIVPLGAWVLRTACAEAIGWPAHVKLAVNLSSVQFRSPDLVRMVIDALDEANLPASRLELEITESVLLQDGESTLATLHELRDLGVRISMDDFGTGYSSLSYVRSFPFDKIKIDRSFVSDLSERADSLAIVRAVTSLGRSLGMTTTAEGVETDAQLARLSSEGCTEVQGYLFSPPCPARDVPELLRILSAPELAA